MTKQPEKFMRVAISELVPYAKNARIHSEEQIKMLQASIREFGFVNPVLIDANNGIIAGHGRVTAARNEGLTAITRRWRGSGTSFERFLRWGGRAAGL